MGARPSDRRAGLAAVIVVTLAIGVLAGASSQIAPTPGADAVMDVIRRVQAGSLQLTWDGGSGYLRSLLKALDVPVSSQVLILASGSLQSSSIGAGNPRALYFNDSVVIGWVRGGFIELISHDANRGPRFYTLRQPAPGMQMFTPESERCLTCHQTARTAGVAGLLLTPTHARPFAERFGGWYVTGRHGGAPHFGNWDLSRGLPPPGADVFNWQSLTGKFDVTGYPTPYSDIVALMVLHHRVLMTNLFNRVREGGVAQSDLVNAVVDGMLFVDEARLPATVQGSSGFSDEFQALGPRDKKGRSLRDLQLTSRLMRYPCSYMIYSPQFDTLPAPIKDAILRRLWDVLSGTVRSAQYDHLTLDTRRAIIEILRDTKRDLPRYYSL